MKPYEETWVPSPHGEAVIETDTGDEIVQVANFCASIQAGLQPDEAARRDLAQQAPAMARLLLRVLDMMRDEAGLASPIEDVLRAAGVLP